MKEEVLRVIGAELEHLQSSLLGRRDAAGVAKDIQRTDIARLSREATIADIHRDDVAPHANVDSGTIDFKPVVLAAGNGVAGDIHIFHARGVSKCPDTIPEATRNSIACQHDRVGRIECKRDS